MFKLNRFLGRIIPIGCLSLLLSILLFSNSWAYADTTADQAKPPELSQSTPLKQPIVLESINGVLDVKLSVEYNAGTIGKNKDGEDNKVCLRSYELISYNDTKFTPNPDETLMFVAPTLKVNPGDKLKISIENKLPKYEKGYDATLSALETSCNPAPETQTSRTVPQISSYNITNLHTHGLEVSPEGISDNVFLKIEPGQIQNYEFNISPEHAPGTFWYHPHYHESTAVQVSSGMTGALIVKGGLDDIKEIKGAKDTIFLFQQIPFSKKEGANYNTVEAYNATSADATWLKTGRSSSINGQDFPKISLKTGELQRWRFIHGGVRESLSVAFIQKDTLSSSKLPKFYEVAADGLSLGEDAFPRDENGLLLEDMNPKPVIELEPGYRSDVLVKAENPGIYYLIDEPVPPSQALNAINDEKLHWLAEVEVVSSTPTEDMQLPKNLAPKPFQSITDEEVGNNRRTITFNIYSSSGSLKFTADGEEYHSGRPERVLNLPLGAAEELTLVSEQGSHPFHIHVNPFEVINDGEGNYKGWKDTIMVRKGKNVTIRTRYNPKYPGKTVYHCHILDHEDQGMMREVNFTKDISKP